jgi:hypothetical protein
VFALDPELIFAGRVAGVFTAFEHGYDDDFDRNGLGWRGLGREDGGYRESNENGFDHCRLQVLFA